MRRGKYWTFEGHRFDPKVCQQEISELTDLAAGVLEFEKRYTHTHGERTPIFRLLSMINTAISENIGTIKDSFNDGTLQAGITTRKTDDIPF